MNTDCSVVLVTASSLEEARTLAKGLLQDKLAACVNLIPQVESHYWWQDKIESGHEILMVIKTMDRKVKLLEEWIKQHHSYSVPEVIAVSIENGSASYLNWIKESLA